MGKLSNSQLKALDELLFDYVSIDHKIAVRKLEISDVPNTDENVGGGRSNIVSKPTENLVAKWDSDQRLNSLYAQKYAVENTLNMLDDDMERIFWLRWARGSVNTWDGIAGKMHMSIKTIYRKRQRILEIFADFYGFS
ncbi:transcriptional regulator [uncultured Streptococcus sp.]|uniref:transcriptional regulator n=1 Tax=uncultured Streptococcus sp. TaxID=83427 RepID=UPI0027DC529F|nr:transcriptional regulator [uncultured Streptococcus sp.]